jgi:hypothetical protein
MVLSSRSTRAASKLRYNLMPIARLAYIADTNIDPDTAVDSKYLLMLQVALPSPSKQRVGLIHKAETGLYRQIT